MLFISVCHLTGICVRDCEVFTVTILHSTHSSLLVFNNSRMKVYFRLCRPPGRPPNWDDQVQYFPEISNALDEKNDMEQESQVIYY